MEKRQEEREEGRMAGRRREEGESKGRGSERDIGRRGREKLTEERERQNEEHTDRETETDKEIQAGRNYFQSIINGVWGITKHRPFSLTYSTQEIESSHLAHTKTSGKL